MMKIILLIFLIGFIQSDKVPGDNIPGCTGNASPFALIDTEPTLVQTVENGKKFTIDYDGRKFYIVSIKGTAYEMGLAYGQLLKNELKVMTKDFFGWAAGYIANNVTQIGMLPKWLRNDIGHTAVGLVKRLLDINYLITKKYTPKRWD